MDIVYLALILAETFGENTMPLPVPPSITTEPDLEYIYSTNQTVELPCKAYGEPQPTYKWMKNGNVLGRTPMIISSADLTVGTITIVSATLLDEGYYQCIATNRYGSALSNIVHLQRLVLGIFPPADTRVYTVKEGEPLKLECEAPTSVPQAVFRWSLTRDQTDQSPVPIETSRRVQIDETGNFYFSHVTMADAQSNRLYKCNHFNAYLDKSTGGSFSQIKVEPVRGLTNIPPNLLYATLSPIIAIKGESFKVKCFFSGRPEPRVTWGRVGGGLPAGRTTRKNFNTELEVTGVRKEDEGYYKCQGVGHSTSEITQIYVDVQSRPKFLARPMNTNAEVDSTVIFECKVDAEPIADIMWLKNGHAIDPSFPLDRMEISPDRSTLTIFDVCKVCPGGASDVMVIQCNASNVHGYAFANAYLNILLPVVIVTFPTSVRLEGDLEDLDEVRFQCEAISDPYAVVAQYTWYFEGKEIDITNSEDFSLFGSALIIDLHDKTMDEKGEFDGKYTCVANNSYSQATASANLEVRGRAVPPIIVNHQPGSGLVVIVVSVGVVVVLAGLIICCVCCCVKNSRHPRHSRGRPMQPMGYTTTVYTPHGQGQIYHMGHRRHSNGDWGGGGGGSEGGDGYGGGGGGGGDSGGGGGGGGGGGMSD